MPDMADAVDWTAIPADAGAVCGYIDGAKYPWPADAWAHFEGRPVLRVSVLADPDAEGFDAETGDAPNDEVATAVAVRVARGQPSVVYANRSTLPAVTAALRAKSVAWLPPSSWPAPGAYLWVADPNIAPGSVPVTVPVQPVAVQDRWEHTYDLSTLYGGWLPAVLEASAPAPAPEPTPVPAPEPTPVPAPAVAYHPAPDLPQLAEGDHGPAVEVLQLLLNSAGAGPIAVDGYFGPGTKAAVSRFQHSHDLGVDGIVGPLTWAKF